MVRVNRPGDRYQGDPLQGIKGFVKIAGIPNLEKFFQETRKEGHRYGDILPGNTKNEKEGSRE